MEVRRILREHVPKAEVRVFGSWVNDTARSTSELDLALVSKKPLPRGHIGDLREAFYESDLPMQVDVLDWHDIPSPFQRVIEEDYEVLEIA